MSEETATSDPAMKAKAIHVFIKGDKTPTIITGTNLNVAVSNQLLTIAVGHTIIFQSIDWSYWQLA